jgi:hypothetical protein
VQSGMSTVASWPVVINNSTAGENKLHGNRVT